MADHAGSDPSRRALLGGLGAGALAGLAGTQLLPAPAVTPDGDGADHGPVDPDTEAIPEADTPYAVWHYRPTLLDSSFAPTLPINVVCPLEDATVEAAIETLQAAGWTDSITEQPRFAYDRTTGDYEPTTWTGGDGLYGIAGRLHVRCFAVADRLSIQAHIDTSPHPAHRIRSFAAARHAVEASFREAGWDVASRELTFGNDQRPDHDGQVSVIRG